MDKHKLKPLDIDLTRADYSNIAKSVKQLDFSDGINIVLVKLVRLDEFEKFAKLAKSLNLEWCAYGVRHTGDAAIEYAYKDICVSIAKFRKFKHILKKSSKKKTKYPGGLAYRAKSDYDWQIHKIQKIVYNKE